VLILAAGAAWGQSTPPPDPTEQVKLLLERVQQLEKRVSELESKQWAAPTSSLSAASIPPAQQATPQQTAAPAGQEHQHGGQEEVQLNIIRYDYNDYFKLSISHYHTPICYKNTTFHHAAWLQTTISRPEMVNVGRTFIPVHFERFLAEGNVPSEGAGLSYSVG